MSQRLTYPLLEGQEGKNFKKARRFLESKHWKISFEDAMSMFGYLKGKMPSLRKNDSKFMLGIIRILFEDGNISTSYPFIPYEADAELKKLETILTYINDQNLSSSFDEDLNGYTLAELTTKFEPLIQQAENSGRESLSQEYGDVDTNSNLNGYTIVRINSFAEASEPKYSNYCDWCITKSVDLYDSYTNDGIYPFYFCLKDGYEKIPREDGSDTPLDTYGLSMIAVSVDDKGKLNTCTCRWNHDNGGNDKIMNVEQLSSLLNASFYSIFKPISPEERKRIERDRYKTIYQRFQEDFAASGSEYIIDVSESYIKPVDGCNDASYYVLYGYDKNYIILNEDGSLVIDACFKDVDYKHNGVIPVKNHDEEVNFVNPSKKSLVSDTWFFYYSLAHIDEDKTPAYRVAFREDRDAINYLLSDGTFLFKDFSQEFAIANGGFLTWDGYYAIKEDNADYFYLYNVQKCDFEFDEEQFSKVEQFNKYVILLTRKSDGKIIPFGIQKAVDRLNKSFVIHSGRNTIRDGRNIENLFEVTYLPKNLHCWSTGYFHLYDFDTLEPIKIDSNESILMSPLSKLITENAISRLKRK